MSGPVRHTIVFLAPLLAGLLAGCEDGSTAPEPVGAIKTVSPAEASGTAGTPLAAPVVVRVLNADGAPMGGVSVEWFVTWGEGSVPAPSTSTDGSGEARTVWTLGTAAGPNALVARAGGHTVSFAALGRPGPAASVTVGPAGDTLLLGEEVKMRATARDAHGNVAEAGVPAWSSSDPAVATVDAEGVVRARRLGAATITAAVAGVQGTARVDVRTVPPSVVTRGPGLNDLTATTMMLRAFVNPEGAAAVAWFEYGTSPTLAGAVSTAQQSLGSGTAGSDILQPLQALTPGETYYYRAVARNAEGTRNGEVSFFRTTAPEPVAAPSAVLARDSFIIHVTWRHDTTQVSHYRLERRVTPAGFWHDWGGSVQGGEYHVRDIDYAVNASYSVAYRLVTCNRIGCSTSSEALVQTQALLPPTNLSAQVLAPTRVALTWSDAPLEDVYLVARRVPGLAPLELAVVRKDATTFTDAAAVPGRTYEYVVYSVKQIQIFFDSGSNRSTRYSAAATVTVTTPPL
jgi:Bacterial Ig-like domain (group 2)